MQSLDLTATTAGEMGLADRVHTALRAEILSQQLAPGARLSVPATAARFGVSRSPAREAIARIVMEGLAHFEPHKGAVVAQLDRGTLVEIYQVREVLEGLACALACARADAGDIAGLRAIVESHGSAIAAGEVERQYELDLAFHERIRQLAANDRLEDQLAVFQRQIRLAMGTTRLSRGGPPQALKEHRRIIDAIESGDPAYAEEAGRAHIRRLLRELRSAG